MKRITMMPLFLALFWVTSTCIGQINNGNKLPEEVKWMYDEAQWGISHHYLAGGELDKAYFDIRSFEEWDYYIANFDVNAYANLVKKLGVGYVIFTITQNRGYLATTSKVYDFNSPPCPVNIPGCENQEGVLRADYTPNRDLLTHLAKALTKKGIKVIAYLPSHVGDRWTGQQISPPKYPDWWINDFIGELSNKWGDTVAGWWFDGYWNISKDEQGNDYPIATKIWNAVRRGNPNAIIALNTGLGSEVFTSPDKYSQYSAGESNELPPLPTTRSSKGKGEKFVQYVGWSFLSEQDPVFAGWGEVDRNLRFKDIEVAKHTVKARENGGVSTWDVAINPSGNWPLAKMKQVQVIGKTMNTTTDTTYSSLQLVNNANKEIIYTGNWQYSEDRKTGAFEQDVHYTENNGDSFSYSFTGTSIVFATSKARDQGNIELFLDNKSLGIFSTYDKYKRQVQEIIYENHHLMPGRHTLKGVKKSGKYMWEMCWELKTKTKTYEIFNFNNI
ncbi:alpha-L-fucosidase [Maribacter ulvicola]|nr:alpha-L-fucosidase [Maribacter ulvicola]